MGVQEVSTLFDIAPVLVCPLPWPIVMKYGGGGGGGGGGRETRKEKRKKKHHYATKARFPGSRNQKLGALWLALKPLIFDCAPFSRKARKPVTWSFDV